MSKKKNAPVRFKKGGIYLLMIVFVGAPIILSSFGILDREVVYQRHRAMRTFGDLRGSLKELVPSLPASNLQWLEMKRLSRFTEQRELYRKEL